MKVEYVFIGIGVVLGLMIFLFVLGIALQLLALAVEAVKAVAMLVWAILCGLWISKTLGVAVIYGIWLYLNKMTIIQAAANIKEVSQMGSFWLAAILALASVGGMIGVQKLTGLVSEKIDHRIHRGKYLELQAQAEAFISAHPDQAVK